MTNAPSLLKLLELSARRPREAMETVKALQLSSPVAWQVFALVLVIELIFAQILGLMLGPVEVPDGALGPALALNPILLGAIQGCLLVLMVFGIHWVGRAFGGTGRLEDAILLMALLQFALVVLQAIEILLMFIIPALAAGVLLFNIFAFFYLLTSFTTALHGFTKPPLVFLGILLTGLGAIFGLSIILSIILAAAGVTLPGLPTNV
ncbi:YIP1 family protein [Oceanicola sp. D3]|uniref:Yip1 family protein n=1 Tax=Oceanicola sp. D3 TaxID=2587163 RepID=UPI00111C9B58|nr:Yip1 family protein [Oceanicola sp. D3]QDC09605.1 YIP1 family protein [Oceanicola sp. D3]